MRHTFTKEHLEQRIAAFSRFVHEQGWALINLGLGKYRTHHFLVKQDEHLVEVSFSPQGGISVSFEAGSIPEHRIRPRLILWIEQEQPRYRGKSGAYSFSDLASPMVTALASIPSAQAHQDESAEPLFPVDGDAAVETSGATGQQWIAVYRPQENFPPYGSATVARWVTIPAPAVLKGRAGTVVTMEFAFDVSQTWLREQFAIHLQQLVAEGGYVLLNTITFPGSTPILTQRENGAKATGYLTAIQLLLFRPQDAQQ